MEMNLYKKLQKVQEELKAPKTQKNKFGGYMYRSCEDIQEAVKPILAKYGAIITLSDDVKGTETNDRVYVVATATFIDIEDGASYSVKACAREEEVKKGMDKAQITGSASSYARKYALNGLLLIDDTKDADTRDNRTTESEPKQEDAPKQAERPQRTQRGERQKEAQEWLDKMDKVGEDENADGFKDVQDGEPIPFGEEPKQQAERPQRVRRERKPRN